MQTIIGAFTRSSASIFRSIFEACNGTTVINHSKLNWCKKECEHIVWTLMNLQIKT